MIGNHSVSVIAEAYKKGFRGFDAEKAFDAIKQTLMCFASEIGLGNLYEIWLLSDRQGRCRIGFTYT